jgi:hypothetical protein
MPHRILTVHPDTGARGIYLDGEIAGLAAPLWIDKAEFPALRGSAAQRIANLEADLAVLLDSKMLAGNQQRVRVHVFSLVPDVYVLGVFASPADITANWWGA